MRMTLPCLSVAYLEVEDEPGGDALAHNVDEEVGYCKQPHIGILQAVVHQQLQQPGLFLISLACAMTVEPSHHCVGKDVRQVIQSPPLQTDQADKVPRPLGHGSEKQVAT